MNAVDNDGNPPCTKMQYGVWDPENLLYGSAHHHCGWPLYENFKSHGGSHFKVSPMIPEFSVQRSADLDGLVDELRRENAKLKEELDVLKNGKEIKPERVKKIEERRI